ncbi:helix-turn-helix domain-containing protein [Nocardia puris]|uniref:helix-turn-helix domain-containing protein n=1 Tax=Nocardia puris TaxID=208602 RepID=UPI001893CCE3|nr:helix-turn-helix domain-containing protein [Nocardia puris]MBF6216217.1 helix-turn-helix domain-containing protein [Nocardia puris]
MTRRKRLDPNQVSQVLELHASGNLTHTQIAAQLDIGVSTVRKILNGHSHRSTTGGRRVTRAHQWTGYRRAVVQQAMAPGADQRRAVEVAELLGISKQAVHWLIYWCSTEPAFAVPMRTPARWADGQPLGGQARCYTLTPPAAWADRTDITHVVIAPAPDDGPATGHTVVYPCDSIGHVDDTAVLFGSPFRADHTEALRRAGYLLVEKVPPPLPGPGAP